MLPLLSSTRPSATGASPVRKMVIAWRSPFSYTVKAWRGRLVTVSPRRLWTVACSTTTPISVRKTGGRWGASADLAAQAARIQAAVIELAASRGAGGEPAAPGCACPPGRRPRGPFRARSRTRSGARPTAARPIAVGLETWLSPTPSQPSPENPPTAVPSVLGSMAPGSTPGSGAPGSVTGSIAVDAASAPADNTGPDEARARVGHARAALVVDGEPPASR